MSPAGVLGRRGAGNTRFKVSRGAHEARGLAGASERIRREISLGGLLVWPMEAYILGEQNCGGGRN